VRCKMWVRVVKSAAEQRLRSERKKKELERDSVEKLPERPNEKSRTATRWVLEKGKRTSQEENRLQIGGNGKV